MAQMRAIWHCEIFDTTPASRRADTTRAMTHYAGRVQDRFLKKMLIIMQSVEQRVGSGEGCFLLPRKKLKIY